MSTTISFHKARSTNNRNATIHLGKVNPTFEDWEITTLFYSALHLVDAYIMKLGLPRQRDHPDRNRLVRCDPRFQPIKHEYNRLYILCRAIRYDRDAAPQENGNALVDYNTIASYLSSRV
jgi:hypothetical protein